MITSSVKTAPNKICVCRTGDEILIKDPVVRGGGRRQHRAEHRRELPRGGDVLRRAEMLAADEQVAEAVQRVGELGEALRRVCSLEVEPVHLDAPGSVRAQRVEAQAGRARSQLI
jgi:hypothetical protein